MYFVHVFISLRSLGPSVARAECGALPDTQEAQALLINIDPKPVPKGQTRKCKVILPLKPPGIFKL